jgi:hypothetical protein
MDLTREDLPRVSVETLKDLKAMKTQYTQAALAQLDATIVASGLTGDKDALHFYMNKVLRPLSCPRRKSYEGLLSS